MEARIIFKSGKDFKCHDLQEIRCYEQRAKLVSFPNEANYATATVILDSLEEIKRLVLRESAQYTFTGEGYAVVIPGTEIAYIAVQG